jgi:hypothetical protein
LIWYPYRFKFTRKEREDITTSLAFQILILLFICTYALFLLLSISFIDAATSPDIRILLPLYFFGVIFTVLFIYDVKMFTEVKLIWRAILIYVFMLVFHNSIGTYALARTIHEDGIWYTHREWRTSEVMEFLCFIPEDIPIYSNGPDVISLLLHRESKMIPVKIHSTSRLPNQHFIADIAQMNADLQHNKGLVVYFDNITWRWYIPDKDELQELVDLSLIRRAADGIIYHGAGID